MDETTNAEISREDEQAAWQKARDRAAVARWDLNIAIFLFAVLIIVVILLFQGVGISIVSPIAIFGLAMVWLVGWRRGRQLISRFYEEEMSLLRQNLKQTIKETVEETIEEKVQKALRERWR